MNHTADTITDEQIRELLAWAHDAGRVEAIERCKRALRKRDRKLETKGQYQRGRDAARAHCAEILNARTQ